MGELINSNHSTYRDINLAEINSETFNENIFTQSDMIKNKKRILIVDDEIFNIEAIKVILEHRFKIKQIDKICDNSMNGKEAVEKIVENVRQNNEYFCNYDLILMDCNMPIMDGYEATENIRTFL
jgi:two-component system sensor histidine kinase/response regulator